MIKIDLPDFAAFPRTSPYHLQRVKKRLLKNPYRRYSLYGKGTEKSPDILLWIMLKNIFVNVLFHLNVRNVCNGSDNGQKILSVPFSRIARKLITLLWHRETE